MKREIAWHACRRLLPLTRLMCLWQRTNMACRRRINSLIAQPDCLRFTAVPAPCCCICTSHRAINGGNNFHNIATDISGLISIITPGSLPEHCDKGRMFLGYFRCKWTSPRVQRAGIHTWGLCFSRLDWCCMLYSDDGCGVCTASLPSPRQLPSCRLLMKTEFD